MRHRAQRAAPKLLTAAAMLAASRVIEPGTALPRQRSPPPGARKAYDGRVLQHHAGPGLRPPPPLLHSGAGDAGAAPHADQLPGDPRADLVAARRGARSRDDPLVGDARSPRSAGSGDDRHHRSPRISERDRGVARDDRRGVRRGRRAGRVRLRRHRPPRPGRRSARPRGEREIPAWRRPRPGRRSRRVHL